MSNIAIKAENLSKVYRIGAKEEIHDTLGGLLFSWVKSPVSNFQSVRKLSKIDDQNSDDVIWALKNISFEIKHGEVLGIIGKNGAGKSTLLKILARITDPTSGVAKINGRIASLLEVGTGFHPELTGRENVFLNGTILGMSKHEVNSNFDEIVDFSGIEKFIDTPVKRYSSGMAVRLAFSVAAFLEPEIMLIDEVLAVGDIQFQKKCLNKMNTISQTGRTVILVSHNMAAISKICNNSMLIDGGKLHSIGNSNDIIDNYFEISSGISKTNEEGIFDLSNHPRNNIEYGQMIKVNKLILCNGDGIPTENLTMGQKLIIKLILNKKSEFIPGLHYTIIFKDQLSNRIASINTQMIGKSIDVTEDESVISFYIEKMPFTDIKINIDINIVQPAIKIFDEVKNAAEIHLKPADIYGNGYQYNSWFGKTFIERFDIHLEEN